ncbi:MAG: acyl-CoA dehydrogenase family protein [Lysinibacillus sp.]
MITKVKDYTRFLTNPTPLPDVFTLEQLSDEHVMLQKTAEKYVRQDVWPVLPAIEQKNFDETKKAMLKAGELGLIGADIAEQDGGLGMGKVSAALIVEQMAKARSFCITFSGQTGIGALPIAYFGTEEQKEKYLPALLSGEHIAAYALTEPAAGTDALGIRTSASLSPCGSHYIVNGEKQWITNSAFADVFIVYAKVDHQHFTAFIVEAQTEGLSTSQEEHKMGLDGSSTRSVILDNVKVPVENVIGEVGRGHIIAFNVLNFGRHKIAASSLGSAKRSMELAISYGKTRQQFGKPLTSFPLIMEKIAQMTILCYAAESAVYRTAGELEERFNQPYDDIGKMIAHFALHCSINKVLATEALDSIVDEALQIHGGYGYMREYEIETIYRDSRINRIFEGTNEINRLLIAQTVGKLPIQEIEEMEEEPAFQKEIQKLNILRKLLKEILQAAAEADRANFDKEQELGAFIADIVTAIYTVESMLVRAIRFPSAWKTACTKVYTHEQAQRLGVRTLNAMNHIGHEQQLAQLAGLLITSHSENLIELKRQIAESAIEKEAYPI